MKVLLVDDEKEILRLLSLFVNQIGHETLQACDGEQAWGMLGIEQVDVMVADVRMPVMDGWTLATRVREAYPGVRIVGIAGMSYVRESPFDVFLGKPFDLHDLRKAISGEMEA